MSTFSITDRLVELRTKDFITGQTVVEQCHHIILDSEKNLKKYGSATVRDSKLNRLISYHK